MFDIFRDEGIVSKFINWEGDIGEVQIKDVRQKRNNRSQERKKSVEFALIKNKNTCFKKGAKDKGRSSH